MKQHRTVFTNPSEQARSGVKQVSIHSFLSPRLDALLRLENPVCPTIYP